MKRGARAALRLAGVIAATALLLVAIAFAVNVRDEAPTARARDLGQFILLDVAPTQNAYLALIGLAAPASDPPIAEGLRIVADHDALMALPPRQRLERLERPWQSPPDALRIVGRFPETCSAVELTCLHAAQTRGSSILSQVKANAELINRYRAATRLPLFEDVVHMTPLAVPPMLNGTGPRRLLLLKAAVDLREGNAEEAIVFLADDIAFWRRAVASGPSLITMLLAARALDDDVALVAELLGDGAFDPQPHASVLRQMLRPLDEMRGFARTVARTFQESVLFAHELFDPAMAVGEAPWYTQVESRMQLWFYLPRATVNRVAETATVVQENGTLLEHCSNTRRLEDRLAAYADVGVDWLFNPMGKWWIATGVDHATYGTNRLCDVANGFALVRAQLEIRLALPSHSVSAFLAARPELGNMYTGQPFEWSEGARVLSFTRLSGGQFREAPLVRVSLPTRTP